MSDRDSTCPDYQADSDCQVQNGDTSKVQDKLEETHEDNFASSKETEECENDDKNDNSDDASGEEILFEQTTHDLVTSLPDVVLVNIMSYLPLKDQYYMSVTCQRFYELFYHPHLWHTVEICLAGYRSAKNLSVRQSEEIQAPNKYLQMIKRFGKFFQNLTLVINGFVCKFPDELENLLQELGHQCRLETLTLAIGTLTSRFHIKAGKYFEPASENDLEAILSFVKNAFRLKTLNLKSWPMFPGNMNNEKLNILSVVQQNNKLQDLENLSLFWCKATEWSERMPVLPSPEVTQSLVIHFQNLHQLSLRSPMFDEHVLEALTIPGRTKLTLLQIFVHYSSTDDDFKIHEVPGRIWQKFVSYNPEVQVECVILSRTPNSELSALLKPDCPLTAIKFMKYSKCDSEIITSLTDKFHKTLRSFVCYCDTTCQDHEVVSLVQKSALLTKLIFHGCLHIQTVEVLAQVRQTDWQEFEILEESLHCNVEEDEDDDRVVAQGKDGALYLVSVMRFHGDDSQKDVWKANMIAKVSEELGYCWKPLAPENCNS